MSDELRIWRVSSAKEVESLSPFSEMPSEWEFEELVVDNPELLERGLRLERMARFISAGPVDLSMVTFHGFQRDGERWLARQVEVEAGPSPGPPRGRSPTVAERRRALREYLADKGYSDLFDRIREDIRGRLPEKGVWVETRRYGVSFLLAEPDNRQAWKTYFGLQAGYITSEVNIYSVSILPQAIHWGGDALDRLREAVSLYDWTHGGQCLRFKSADEWDQVRRAVLEFVDAEVANRAGRADLGAH